MAHPHRSARVLSQKAHRRLQESRTAASCASLSPCAEKEVGASSVVPQPLSRRSGLRWDVHLPHDLVKARIAAQRCKQRIHLYPDHSVTLIVVGHVQPSERMVILLEARIGPDEPKRREYLAACVS